MAVIKPFKALRPIEKFANRVASVPYDVVDRDEAEELAKNNPLSFLRVTRSEIELDKNTDPYAETVYKKAKENLEKLQKEGTLFVDKEPHIYVYQLEMKEKKQIGLAATFSVDDYDNNRILKHEKTRKVKEDDRTNHILTTAAQTGPVFMTYKAVSVIDNLINAFVEKEKPIYNFTAVDGIKHTIWILPKDIENKVIEEIAKVNNLYIADGHHRAASASRARKIRQESNPKHDGCEEYNFFVGVLFPSNQLKILPYNRVVIDLNGLTKDGLINSINEKFNVQKSDIKQPKQKRTFCMYLDGYWYELSIKDSIKASLSMSKPVAETLDCSILQDFLLNPILGIDDPRTNKRIDFIGGIRGTQELEKLVNTGKAKIAFSLYPVTLDDLIKISDAGEIMPPKSTWFEPKLRDGLLVHLI
jgi:uncharacterized protein (DUF1015 family)